MHLQQLKGMQSFKQGMRKWYHFTTEGIRKGYLFVKNGIKKGKGLDLGAEPPCITKFIIGQQTILPEPVLGAVYIGERKILVPGRS